MTRKRFIKLCMSKGISRNSASEIATTGIALGYTYESLLDAQSTMTDAINKMCDLIVEAIPTVIQALVDMVPELVTEISENPDILQQL